MRMREREMYDTHCLSLTNTHTHSHATSVNCHYIIAKEDRHRHRE